MLYTYVKKPPSKPKFRLSRRFTRTISATFLVLGAILIGQVVVPVAGSYILLLPQYSQEIVSPLASYFQPITPPLSPKRVFASQELSPSPKANYDPYRPSTWFANTNRSGLNEVSSLHSYFITVPKLKIENAAVEIGGDDLKKLSLPGQLPLSQDHTVST